MASKQQCTRALEQYQGQLSSLKNVVGLGIVHGKPVDVSELPADKQYVVAVYVSKKLNLAQLKPNDVVPTTLDLQSKKSGSVVKTRVIEQGEPEFEQEQL
jgi:hypothetical protein